MCVCVFSQLMDAMVGTCSSALRQVFVQLTGAPLLSHLSPAEQTAWTDNSDISLWSKLSAKLSVAGQLPKHLPDGVGG